MKKSVIVIIVLAVLVAGGWFFAHKADKNAATNKSNIQSAAQNAGFNKKQFSLTDPNSLWVIADKHRPLQPKTYAPSDLVVPNIPLRLTAKDDEMKMRKEAADALKNLYDAAQQDGLKLMVSSGYRSYQYQVNLYNYYVKQQGKATADSQSARPGFSEHQTGLAVDVEPSTRKCEVEACFGQTPEGKWVAANAYKYGFVIRYQEGKQNITGYVYEPWHIRYVGTSLATELNKQGNPTLEEYFGLGAAPDYL
jgi:D-alanyl-D-alanine carboxypeptidase